MHKQHRYSATVIWTGNTGRGTSGYGDYERSHVVRIAGKPELPASSDTPFRGDATRHNPEDLLLASLSSCHMLWYLHLCADAGIVVTAYSDNATAVMEQTAQGGHFTEATLYPEVTITDGTRIEEANGLHAVAHDRCFIANSVNFPVKHVPTCKAIG